MRIPFVGYLIVLLILQVPSVIAFDDLSFVDPIDDVQTSSQSNEQHPEVDIVQATLELNDTHSVVAVEYVDVPSLGQDYVHNVEISFQGDDIDLLIRFEFEFSTTLGFITSFRYEKNGNSIEVSTLLPTIVGTTMIWTSAEGESIDFSDIVQSEFVNLEIFLVDSTFFVGGVATYTDLFTDQLKVEDHPIGEQTTMDKTDEDDLNYLVLPFFIGLAILLQFKGKRISEI